MPTSAAVGMDAPRGFSVRGIGTVPRQMEIATEGEKTMSVGWGVIGCGRLATARAIPRGIQAASNARLVGVADAVAERAQETAERFEVRSYADADELLSDPSIEAVYVATPTSSHAELTIAAARRGKHVLCEKPLSLNPAEAEEMVRVCREQGVTLGHGTKMRYNACHVKMREMIRDGSIGQPVAMHALFLERWPSDLAHLSAGDEEIWKLGDERIFTWRQRKRLGGGPMADMGVHVIDTMVFMMGRVKEVASFCDTLTSELDVEDTASVLVKFENGVQATIECHSSVANFEGRRSLRVSGSLGSLLAEGTLGFTGRLFHFDGRDDPEVETQPQKIEVSDVDLHETQFRLFSESVETGTPYPISGEEGLYAIRVLDAVYRSSEERRFVAVE